MGCYKEGITTSLNRGSQVCGQLLYPSTVSQQSCMVKDTIGNVSKSILGKDSPKVICSRSHFAPSINKPWKKKTKSYE